MFVACTFELHPLQPAEVCSAGAAEARRFSPPGPRARLAGVDIDDTRAAGDRRDDATLAASSPTIGLERGAVVDRYLLLDRLGAGAMGVVYAAFDPELDRKVALKLVAPQADGGSGTAGRARLLREAQALAKLSHPNVVAVFDAGTHGENVWIAMEFVAGRTLRAWAEERPRPWSEVLPALVDAARGVAAAHAAGLVHRDLKPDNVMIGADGRVRVMDFGLARGRRSTSDDLPLAATLAAGERARPAMAALDLPLTQAGSLQGTPAYMAPEQWHGHDAGAAADQFGWSVMAWELLHGERPFAGETMMALSAAVVSGQKRPPPRGRKVPRWLRAVLERGLAVDPARRWPTMTALLAALGRGQRVARLKTAALALAGAAALGLAGAAVHQRDTARRAAACEAAGAEIDAVWNDATRTQLRRAFVETGANLADAVADRVMPWLDRQAEAWKRARTDACLDAEVRGVWTPELLDRATWCLDDRRTVLASLISELGRADPTTVQRAVVAVSSLGPVTSCVDAAALLRQPEPPRERREDVRELRAALSRARALADAGRFADALAAATRARARAEELGWRPLVAAARAREGRISLDAAMYEQAEEVLQTAYFEAARLGLWDLAAEAATDLIRAVGEKLSRPADGRAWVRHAEVAAAHAGDPSGLLEASRVNNLANVQVRAGLYAEALLLYRRGLEIQEAVLGPDHPWLANSLNNIAIIHYSLGDYPAARALFERALAVREQALGPAHPVVADTLGNLAAIYHAEGAYAAALPLHERAVTAMEAAFGPDHPKVADALNNLAADHLALGQYAASLAQHERALAIRERARGPDHPNVAQTLQNLGNVHAATGRHAEARALFERALAIQEKTLGRDHPEVADTLKSLAATHLEQNDAAAALPLVERAAAIFAAHDGEQPGELAGHFTLARALAATAGDRARALAEAETARDGYRKAGPGKLKELAEVEAWLSRHRPADAR